jgi:hypothetical protein
VPEDLKPSDTFIVLSDIQTEAKRVGLDFADENRQMLAVYVDPEHPNGYKMGQMKEYLNSLLAKGIELILVDKGQKLLMKWGTVD